MILEITGFGRNAQSLLFGALKRWREGSCPFSPRMTDHSTQPITSRDRMLAADLDILLLGEQIMWACLPLDM